MAATASTTTQSQGHTPSEGGNPLGRAIAYLGRYPRLASFSIVAVIVATIAQLLVPRFVQEAIDSAVATNLTALETGTDTALSALITACFTIVGLSIARGLFAFAQSYSSQVLSQDIAFELRNDIFEKIQRLSFSYHDRNRTGQLMIRATDDVERLRGFIGQGLLIAIQALMLLVGALVLMFSANVRLTLIVLPILPIAVVVFGFFGRIAQPLFSKIQIKLSSVNTVLEENLSGLKVVKAFAQEPREFKRFQNASEALRDSRINVNKYFSILF
ncbi:MAG: ABC transporter ATP-binding protein, partial [Candidatus Promineifilaceae bacterium]